MADIVFTQTGYAGRVTLNRPEALNALTYDMAMALADQLRAWATDDTVRVVIIDAAGDKAFCAGGDIADLYATGRAGDFAFGQKFWRDEYRLNDQINRYTKPIVTFMQGFTMGGGVGVGCHASHRIVGETSQIAMPECGIGLVPDVGGSLILANAPGSLGAYLGLTATRMEAGNAIYCGFADHFIPQDLWNEAKAKLSASGDMTDLTAFYTTAPHATLADDRATLDPLFETQDLGTLASRLSSDPSALAQKALKAVSRNSPLAMAVTLKMLDKIKGTDLRTALAQEYRFTARAMEHGDFLEGIRAAIIDKDRAPKWGQSMDTVDEDHIQLMLSDLGDIELSFEEN